MIPGFLYTLYATYWRFGHRCSSACLVICRSQRYTLFHWTWSMIWCVSTRVYVNFLTWLSIEEVSLSVIPFDLEIDRARTDLQDLTEERVGFCHIIFPVLLATNRKEIKKVWNMFASLSVMFSNFVYTVIDPSYPHFTSN